MYNTIFINFNVLCDKIIQIELIKKKTANQNDKFKEKSKRIQSFFKQHKKFSYDKNKNKNQNHFQNKNEKNDHKNDQKKISFLKMIHRIADYESEYDEK